MKNFDLNIINREVDVPIDSIIAHRDVLVLVGGDSQETRTMDWIDSLTHYDLKRLVAVYSRKGTFWLFWTEIPAAYREVSDIEIPDGDVWSVYKSIVIPQ